MDKRFITRYNRDRCVGSSIIERSYSSERCRCNSGPSAPFLMLDYYGVDDILQTYERASEEKSRDSRGYQSQAFGRRDFIRASQKRGRAYYCRNQQKSNRTQQKIWRETSAGFVCRLNALANKNKKTAWGLFLLGNIFYKCQLKKGVNT